MLFELFATALLSRAAVATGEVVAPYVRGIKYSLAQKRGEAHIGMLLTAQELMDLLTMTTLGKEKAADAQLLLGHTRFLASDPDVELKKDKELRGLLLTQGEWDSFTRHRDRVKARTVLELGYDRFMYSAHGNKENN